MKTATEADEIERRIGLSLKPETKAALNAPTKRSKARKPDNALVPASQQTRDAMTGLPVHEPLIVALERMAKDPNIDIVKMKELYAMHRDEVAEAQKVAFNKAMASCQQELPRVLRDATNSSTSSKFARLETIDRITKPITTKYGFSVSYGTDKSDLPNHYGITATVMHDVGHTREYRADVPADLLGMKGNPNKTATHAFGSTIAYGRRYLKCLVFDIVTANEDDDGNAAGGVQPLTDAQATVLDQLLLRLAEIRKIEVSAMEEEFCKLFKIEKIADLPGKAFKQAETQINQAIAALTKKGGGK